MGIFGFGKSYTKDDLNSEIAQLRTLYVEAMSNRSPQMKKALASQLKKVLEVCRKGNFAGWEIVEWPTPGNHTSLRNVTPTVQVMIDMM